MPSIFVTTTAQPTRYAPYARANYERVLRAAQAALDSKYALADAPEAADFILFVESTDNYHFDLLRSPLYRAHRPKCFLFDTRDSTIPFVPGIYASIPGRLRDCAAYKSGFYIRVFDNELIHEFPPAGDDAYLFSFVGRVSNCPAVRAPLLTFTDRSYTKDANSGQADNDALYASIIEKSKFVLCPRGYGPSTWRLFETMKAGRVPVIISDEWTEPPFVPWNMFAVRIPESEVGSIPRRLASLEPMAGKMGRMAARIWRENFSLSRAFNWIGDTLSLIETNAAASRWPTVLSDRQHSLRFLKERLRRAIYRKLP